MSFGSQNLTNLSAYNQSSSYNLNETAQISGELVGSTLGGGTEYAGLIVLAFFAFITYKSEIGTDTAAAVMVPTVMFLGTKGFLPYGEGIVYGAILGVAAIFGFGLYQWAFR